MSTTLSDPRARSLPLVDHLPLSPAARRHVVRLIFLTYILLIAEGALRKWGFPEFQRVLFLLRDPIVLLIYSFSLPLFLAPTPAFLVWLMFASLAGLLGGLGHALHGNGILAWWFGARNYFLYMPLAFIIGQLFTASEIRKFIRLNLLLAIPISLLIIAQYYSSPHSFVNRSITEDVTEVVHGVVRPYGTFTYTSQQVIFAGSLIAVLAASWILRMEYAISNLLLVCGGPAILAIALLTGSRSIYFMAAQIAVLVLLASIAARHYWQRAAARSFLILFVVGAGLLFATLLNSALDNILKREAGAGGSRVTLHRAVSMYVDFLPVLEGAPLLGYGIGAGTPAARRWVVHGPDNEGELGRVIMELGPVLGLVFICLRFGFVGFLLHRSWRAAIEGNPVGLVFLGFAWGMFTVGQITSNANTNGYLAWLYAGLVLATTRLTPVPGSSYHRPLLQRRDQRFHVADPSRHPDQPSHPVPGTVVSSPRSPGRAQGLLRPPHAPRATGGRRVRGSF